MINADNVLVVQGPANRRIISDGDSVVRLKPSGLELARFCDAKSEERYLRLFVRRAARLNCTLYATPVVSKTDKEYTYDPRKLRKVVPG